MGKGLHAIHLNIRSLLPKIDQLRAWLSYINPNIITLSETWLTNSTTDAIIHLENYVMYSIGLTEVPGEVESLPIFHLI